MTSLIEGAALVLGGGGSTVFAQAIGGWWKDRRDTRRDVSVAGARQEEHRDNLTIELLQTARAEIKAMRDEMDAMRGEAAKLRPLMVVGAHLEEALDHLHAILHADGDLEVKAAERRARAFLKRLRPTIGDLRNFKQASDSAIRLAGQAPETEK